MINIAKTFNAAVVLHRKDLLDEIDTMFIGLIRHYRQREDFQFILSKAYDLYNKYSGIMTSNNCLLEFMQAADDVWNELGRDQMFNDIMQYFGMLFERRLNDYDQTGTVRI